ncbi:MAG: two-component regulator propeller domain-containing protein [Acidobacteriota bacterium]|nr:two-component regulator propeller domain-containing protein [Acidobacteriota bacterium]
MIQDRLGYLWVGTVSGLNRFDGETFKIFRVQDGLQNDNINALAEDGNGRLWIATTNGLCSFDGTRFTNYNKAEGLPGEQVFCLLADSRNRLWCGTDNGLVFLEKGVLVTPPWARRLKEPVRALFLDRPDRLWIGTENQVYLYSGDALIPHPATELEGGLVSDILDDRKGNVWVASDRGVFGLKNDAVHTHFPADGPNGGPTGDLLIDSSGTLWVGTNRGVMLVEDGKSRLLTGEQGFPLVLVYSLLESRDGMIWLSGVPGLVAVKSRCLEVITDPDGPGTAPIRGIIRNRNGHILTATLTGLSRFDGERWQKYNRADGLNHDFLITLHEDDDGVLWIGGRGGLNRMENGRITDVSRVPHEMSIYDIEGGPRGKLWLSALIRGVFTLEADGLKPVEVPGQKFTRSRFLLDRQNQLWISGDKGLTRWDDSHPHTFTVADGLAGNRPYALFEDADGRIWICYHDSRGVTILENDVFRTLTTRNGLADNSIYMMGQDPEGTMWLGSSKGVDRLGPDGITNFNVRDGLSHNETNSGAFAVGLDRTLWFGTMSGLTRYYPSRDRSEDLQPRPHIALVEMGGRSIAAGEVVSHEHRDMVTEIHFLNHLARSHLDARFRLAGYSDTWQPLEHKRPRFDNLKPGDYTLEVQARFYSRPWSQPTRFSFKLRPPPWETWWARLAGLSIIGLMIYGLVKVRIRSVENQKIALEKVVAERTSELRAEIDRHKQTQTDLLAAQSELVQTAHEAGRADIAIGVLHNIGNLLSSVNISAGMIREGYEKSKLDRLSAATSLLSKHLDDLENFIRDNPKGRSLLLYLVKLEKLLKEERSKGLNHVVRLLDKVDVIRNYIMMHQTYVRAGFFEEEVVPADVLEDALLLQAGSIDRHGIKVVKEYEDVPRLRLQKAKLINILINLYKNAREAMEYVPKGKRRLTIRLYLEEQTVVVAVTDNGSGIKAEHRAKLFSQGFTTKKTGNGFGLHSCANYMREMGGSIHVESDGEGKGAAFFLRFPLEKSAAESA